MMEKIVREVGALDERQREEMEIEADMDAIIAENLPAWRELAK